MRVKAFIVATAVLALLAAAPLQAQQWSTEQQEVWKNVQTYWELDAKGNVEGFMGYFDPSYVGWSYDSAMPMGREAVHKFIAYEFQHNQTEVYHLSPVAIQVHGDFAFADYYYTVISTDADGKVHHSKGRWTDILAKRGERWVLIGDHGGDMDSED